MLTTFTTKSHNKREPHNPFELLCAIIVSRFVVSKYDEWIWERQSGVPSLLATTCDNMQAKTDAAVGNAAARLPPKWHTRSHSNSNVQAFPSKSSRVSSIFLNNQTNQMWLILPRTCQIHTNYIDARFLFHSLLFICSPNAKLGRTMEWEVVFELQNERNFHIRDNQWLWKPQHQISRCRSIVWQRMRYSPSICVFISYFVVCASTALPTPNRNLICLSQL